MTNHPNRGSKPSAAANPTPRHIRESRAIYGHTQTQAAALIYSTVKTWQTWEAGTRRMHPALYELYKIKSRSQQEVGMPPTKKMYVYVAASPYGDAK